MASLSEMMDYAKAQQPRNGLAEVASHFLAGADSGYDAGHAAALKNQENPMVDDPMIPGKKVRLDVYSKLLDVQAKQAAIEEAKQTNALIQQVTGAKEMDARDKTLGSIATNALQASSGTAGIDNTMQGKVANLVQNPTPRKPTKTTVTIANGKPTISMDFGDSKKSTVDQVMALKTYSEKGDADSAAQLATAFPDGLPDWASKHLATLTDLKQKKTAIDDAKEQVRQDRLEQQYRASQTSVRGDPSIARTELQRDAAITAYNRIKEIKDRGEVLNPIDYVDTLGQVYKARTGAAPQQDVLEQARQDTAKGKGGKWYTYFTGKEAPATTPEIQDSLLDMASSMGMQADKLHAGYMKSRLKAPTGLAPDRQANVDSGRGMSFQEATGYQPKVKVSNGKETLLINATDAADAAKDGYKPI